jgi:signal transduction histidine kinase/ligand-binding sensor domain-containing protein
MKCWGRGSSIGGFLALFILVGRCACADSIPPASGYLRTNFTDRDGLSANIIDAIAQTKNGTLWIGTPAGLDRFDGHSFSRAGTQPVSTLGIGPDGDLWAATDQGVSRFREDQLGRWESLSPVTYHLGRDTDDVVTCMLIGRDGTIWAANDKGLYRLNGGAFALVASAHSMSRLEEAHDGHLLIVSGDGFLEWDGHQLVTHPELPPILGVPQDGIFHVVDDHRGNRWYATANGLKRMEKGVAQRFIGTDTDPKGKMAAYRIFEDRSGNLLTSAGNSVYRLPRGKEVMDPILPQQGGRALFVDQEGDLWAGTNGQGLNRFKEQVVHMFGEKDGLPNPIVMTVLTAHDGTLWVGNNCGGISWFDGKRFHAINGFENTCVNTLAEDADGDLWIGTYEGIFRRHGSSFTQYSVREGLPGRKVTSIQIARDGSMWIAHSAGLSRFKDGHFRTYKSADGLSSDRARGIYEYQGAIWAATRLGLDHLQGDHFVRISSKIPGGFTILGEDPAGGLYVGNDELGVRRWENGNLSGILMPRSALAMLIIGKDVWFSGSGIVRVSLEALRRDLHSPDEPRDYLEFSGADGLTPALGAVTRPTAARTPDGRLWFAQFQGLAMIDPTGLQPAPKAEVHIGEIDIDRKIRPPGNQLSLSAGPHHIEIHFDTIEVGSPEHTHLQYRLDDVESEWFDAEPVHTAIYNNLPPGTHRFHVRASNRDGIWDRGGIAYDIIQAPYYYQTRLFQLAVIAAGILGIFGLHAYRLRQAQANLNTRLEERLAERERIARELHDTLLQGFQGLMLHFQRAFNQIPAHDPARETMKHAMAAADEVLVEGRERVRDLRMEETATEFSDLVAAYGEELAKDGDVKFKLALVSTPERLHPLVGDEVYQIAREALANAFRHSAATQVEVEITYHRERLSVRVRDNGCGIAPEILTAGRKGHWGLSGMRERAVAIGAKLSIWSHPGRGTEIDLTVPSRVAYLSGHSDSLWQRVKEALFLGRPNK